MEIINTTNKITFKFSFKERIRLLFKGSFEIKGGKDAYVFASSLVKIASETIEEHGDFVKHGKLNDKEKINAD